MEGWGGEEWVISQDIWALLNLRMFVGLLLFIGCDHRNWYKKSKERRSHLPEFLTGFCRVVECMLIFAILAKASMHCLFIREQLTQPRAIS